jgi:hypothetical protein
LSANCHFADVKLNGYCRWLGLPVLLLLGWGGERTWSKLQQARLRSQEYEPPPAGMGLVPAGELWMGSNDPKAEPDEKPLRRVFVPAFYIDRFELTNRRYKELMPDHCYAAGEDDLPVTHVLKRDAEEFCRRAGRRLPASAEWEEAARGTDGRVYPWGDEFIADRANINRRVGRGSTYAPLCDSPLATSKGQLHCRGLPFLDKAEGLNPEAGSGYGGVSHDLDLFAQFSP